MGRQAVILEPPAGWDEAQVRAFQAGWNGALAALGEASTGLGYSVEMFPVPPPEDAEAVERLANIIYRTAVLVVVAGEEDRRDAIARMHGKPLAETHYAHGESLRDAARAVFADLRGASKSEQEVSRDR